MIGVSQALLKTSVDGSLPRPKETDSHFRIWSRSMVTPSRILVPTLKIGMNWMEILMFAQATQKKTDPNFLAGLNESYP
ncbi:unnamed protein product [Cochlearia groenlandica]